MKTKQTMAMLTVTFALGAGLAGVALGGCGAQGDDEEPGAKTDDAVIRSLPTGLTPVPRPNPFPTGVPTVVPTATATVTNGFVPTAPADLCTKVYDQPDEGFFCETPDCADSPNPFYRFEYTQASSGCYAGGSSPDATHPYGMRGVVWHSRVEAETREEELWLYDVCAMDDDVARQAADEYESIDPVDSHITYYCYADGTSSTSPSRDASNVAGAVVKEKAVSFVTIYDPRCGACVMGPILEPFPPTSTQ